LWFVKSELAKAAEAPAAAPASPNNRPGIALIGCGGMGQGDIENAANYGDIVALCDVDDNHVNSLARKYTRNGKTPAKYSDFRKLLEDKDVNIIVQATPDHWHSLINIAAANAKKDIYAEKPLTLTIDEGRHVIKAVRDNKVVLQTGTQQRSSQRFLLACELVRNQRIGKLQKVSVWLPAGLREGPFQTKPVPEGLNWDFWLGQAPKVDYMSERCHSTFRWWWDYSGGPVTDWGAHHNDIARWAIGQDGPISVEAKVITPPIPGGYVTPSQFEATLTWADGITQVVQNTLDDSPFGQVLKADGQRNGIKFEGEKGWIWVNRDEISASDPALLHAPLPEGAIRLESSRNHMGNFFESVRSRKDPICPVEGGHYSAVVGHLIVIALRSGLKLKWDSAKETFVGDGAETANGMMARKMRAPYDYTFVG
jgi:predicted dehydrogenase